MTQDRPRLFRSVSALKVPGSAGVHHPQIGVRRAVPPEVTHVRRAGIAEGVIMKIRGWRTRSVFERYAIVSQTDIADALKKLEAS
jgi:hypothetical protein